MPRNSTAEVHIWMASRSYRQSGGSVKHVRTHGIIWSNAHKKKAVGVHAANCTRAFPGGVRTQVLNMGTKGTYPRIFTRKEGGHMVRLAVTTVFLEERLA